MPSLDHFGLTDAGKVRQNNEDALLSGGGQDPALFAVADGIGGFEAGEVASSMAVESLQSLAPGGSLEAAIQEANRRVYSSARSDEKLSGMGTTVVAVRITEPAAGSGPEAEVAHVGDSRAYLLRGGEMSPLTEDHSLVAELVRSGSLTRAQASDHPQKNLITRALGAEEEVQVDSARYRLHRGDRLVLCSDGLPDMVPEGRIRDLVAGDPAAGVEESARSLISAALSAGGTDNVTVVVVDVLDTAARQSGANGAADSTDSTELTGATEATEVAGGAAAAREAGAGARDRGGGQDSSSSGPEPGDETTRDRDAGGRDAGERRSRRRLSKASRTGTGQRRSRRDHSTVDDQSRRQERRETGRGDGDGNYARLREGESLIPGVWDGVVEEPEPREPTPEEVAEQFRVRPETEDYDTREDPRRRRRRKSLRRGWRAASTLVRGLAALALVGLLLVPPYLWWSTRYFMAYEGDEVAIYQGVPYDFLGNDLNRLDRRTGVQQSDIAEPYQDRVRDNVIYTEDRLQTVLEDLQEE